ncbi:MAG: DUF1223 domain-containing protein [Bacteroidetes bacterium]|nr:DUF1223 domain-containing protein [Bacteroidota bacterium]
MNIKTKIVGAFAIIIAASLLSFSNLNHKKNGALTPVAIVELFSSDGCNSCPPAGDNLNDIIRDAANNKRKIYCLDFHVDYKNNGGWVDPFSSKAFTERQNEYTTKFNLDKAYTKAKHFCTTILFMNLSPEILRFLPME